MACALSLWEAFVQWLKLVMACFVPGCKLWEWWRPISEERQGVWRWLKWIRRRVSPTEAWPPTTYSTRHGQRLHGCWDSPFHQELPQISYPSQKVSVRCTFHLSFFPQESAPQKAVWMSLSQAAVEFLQEITVSAFACSLSPLLRCGIHQTDIAVRFSGYRMVKI